MFIKPYFKLMSLKGLFGDQHWLRSYQRSFLAGDIKAGLTVGVVIIPQGMAYALIAGLPPVYGLYAAIIPGVVYALLGTSRQLSVGPVAIDSLIIAAGIGPVAAGDSTKFIGLVLFASIAIGLFQLLFGLLKFGFMARFLSRSVIIGFTHAAALIIAFSQLPSITGISNTEFNELNLLTFGLSLAAIGLLFGVKKWFPNFPFAVVLVVLGVMCSLFVDLSTWDIAAVGAIPSGLPSFRIPDVSIIDMKAILPTIITLSLIGYLETISIGKTIRDQYQEDYVIDTNREFIALGFGNILGGLFGAMPSTAGFSRSAVNARAGAKTNLANVISSVVVLIVLGFLTEYIQGLPVFILSSIIIVSVLGLLEWGYVLELYKKYRTGFYLYALTLVAALVLGVVEGILIGAGLSVLMVLKRITRPHQAILGRLPNTTDYRNVKRFEQIETREDVLVFRHDGELFFATADVFKERLLELVKKSPDARLLILEIGSVSYIDYAGMQTLQEIVSKLNKSGVGVYFSSIIGPVRDALYKAGFTAEVGEDHFFTSVHDACQYYEHSAVKRPKQMIQQALQHNPFKDGAGA